MGRILVSHCLENASTNGSVARESTDECDAHPSRDLVISWECSCNAVALFFAVKYRVTTRLKEELAGMVE